MNENIEKCKSNDTKIIFSPGNEENFGFLYNIRYFGKFYIENEELNEEGPEKDAIETVMEERKCSRVEAIMALRAHNGDPVGALSDI